MQGEAMTGKRFSVIAEYVLRILGLAFISDTFVGTCDIRLIPAGEAQVYLGSQQPAGRTGYWHMHFITHRHPPGQPCPALLSPGISRFALPSPVA